MSGTYEVHSTITPYTKYACTVSFNGKVAEYYEIETSPMSLLPAELFVDIAEEDLTEELIVSKILQLVADQDLTNNPE